MARRIPLPRLTRRQRTARWQRERRQQAFIVVIFSAVLFFVLGLVSWATSEKYYQDNLKPAMRFDGEVIPMRDWQTEKKYQLSRFYVEFGVPPGYENDPQIAEQKASYDRSALDTLEEYQILDREAKAQGISFSKDAIQARYAAGFTEADIKWHTRHDLLRDEFTKRQQDQGATSPTAQVHLAQIQVATPRPVGGDFQAFSDQLKKVSDVSKALDGGTDFAEVAKKYSEDSATSEKGGDMGWIAHGMLTDLAAEAELFSIPAGQLSKQHNLLTTTTWYKVLEKSDSRALDDDQKKTIKDNAYQYWLNRQKKAHDVLRLIPGLEFE